MIETHFNAFDAIVLGVLVLSTLIAFFRGLVREVLSLGAWIGAGFITLYLLPHSVEFVKGHVHAKNEMVIAAMAALGTFVLALLAISLVTSIIMRYVKSNSEVGMLDNILGLAFGALRGALIVSGGYLMYSVMLPDNKDDYPQWLKEAKTAPYAQEGAEFLRKAAPQYIADLEKGAQDARDKARDEKDQLKDEMHEEREKIQRPDVPITFAPLRTE